MSPEEIRRNKSSFIIIIIIYLRREIGRLWQLRKVHVVPVVVGALGSVTKEFDRWMEKLGVPVDVGAVQKTALLGTARILRMVLEM